MSGYGHSSFPDDYLKNTEENVKKDYVKNSLCILRGKLHRNTGKHTQHKTSISPSRALESFLKTSCRVLCNNLKSFKTCQYNINRIYLFASRIVS